MFLTWFIKYPDIVNSEITITTANPPIQVYAKASGRIQHLLQENESLVKKDDWILVIYNNASFEDMATLKGIALKALQDTTANFGKNNLPNLRLGDLQNEYTILRNAAREYRQYTTLAPRERQDQLNFNRLNELDNQAFQLEKQRKLLEAELDLLQKDYKRHQDLLEAGAVSAQTVEQKELDLLAVQRNLNNIQLNLIDTESSKSLIYKELQSEKYSDFEIQLRMRNNLYQAYNQVLTAIENWELRYVVKAPIDGIINFYDYRSEEQFVQEGTSVCTIVPEELEAFYGIIKMPIQNSGKVTIGQPVNIKLYNYPFEEFGLLKGKVKAISKVPNEGFYSVAVNLPEQLNTESGQALPIQHEYIGSSEIVTRDLRLIQRFFNSILRNVK